MYYMDDYRNVTLVKDDSLMSLPRAYQLSNGDVFTIKDKEREYTLQYENCLFYEVIFKVDDQSNQYSYYDSKWLQSAWERTGIVYTPEEVNKLI